MRSVMWVPIEAFTEPVWGLARNHLDRPHRPLSPNPSLFRSDHQTGSTWRSVTFPLNALVSIGRLA